MRVTHYSRDDVTGGAARCALRLHEGLRSVGVDSQMIVARRRGTDPAVEGYRPTASLGARGRRWLRRRNIDADLSPFLRHMPDDTELFSDDRAPLLDEPLSEAGGSDLINLHWISGFLDVGAVLRSCSAERPVVWTLHDMNLITGGCHYDRGCARFLDSCGECPQLGSVRSRDLSSEVLDRKRRALAEVPAGALHIVTPSQWLAGEVARSSIGARLDVSVIPYGLDTEILYPRPKKAAREALGLPLDARVVLFVAQSVANPRKGYPLLVSALRDLADVEGLFLLSVGSGSPDTRAELPGRHVGYTTDDHVLAAVYSAADVFVTPALQDNLPATVLESMACGTPVVGFDVGGVPEMIRPGITGALAPPGDARALGAALREVLASRDAVQRLGDNARAIAEQEYSLDRQANSYLALYDRLAAAGENQ